MKRQGNHNDSGTTHDDSPAIVRDMEQREEAEREPDTGLGSETTVLSSPQQA